MGTPKEERQRILDELNRLRRIAGAVGESITVRRIRNDITEETDPEGLEVLRDQLTAALAADAVVGALRTKPLSNPFTLRIVDSLITEVVDEIMASLGTVPGLSLVTIRADVTLMVESNLMERETVNFTSRIFDASDPVERAVLGNLIDRNRELRLFPDEPTRMLKLRTFVSAMERQSDKTGITRDISKAILGDPDADPALKQQAAQFLQSIKVEIAGLTTAAFSAVAPADIGAEDEDVPRNLIQAFGLVINAFDAAEIQAGTTPIPATFLPEPPDPIEIARQNIENAFTLDSKGKLTNTQIADRIKDILRTEPYNINISTKDAFLANPAFVEEDFAATKRAVLGLIGNAQAEKGRLLAIPGLSTEEMAAQLGGFVAAQLDRAEDGEIGGVAQQAPSPFDTEIERFKAVAREEEREETAEADIKNPAAALDRILRDNRLTRDDLTEEALDNFEFDIGEGKSGEVDATLERLEKPRVRLLKDKLAEDEAERLEGLRGPAALTAEAKKLFADVSEFSFDSLTESDKNQIRRAAKSADGSITQEVAEQMVTRSIQAEEAEEATTPGALEGTLRSLGIGGPDSSEGFLAFLRETVIPQIQPILEDVRGTQPEGAEFDVRAFAGTLLGVPEFLEPREIPDDLSPLDASAETILARTPQSLFGLPSVSEEEFERRFGADTPGLALEDRAALVELGVPQLPTVASVGTITPRELLNIQPSTDLDVLRFTAEAAEGDTAFQSFLLGRLGEPDFETEFGKFAGQAARDREQAAFKKFASRAGPEGVEPGAPSGTLTGSFRIASRPEPISRVDFARTRVTADRELFEQTPAFLQREQNEADLEEAKTERERETAFQRSLRRGRGVFTGAR